MTVEQLDVVDIISINKAGAVVLAVCDHLNWADTIRHQEALQAKLNKYLAFIESGEILERYPEAKESAIVIRVVLKFAPDADGAAFLGRAAAVVESAGFGFKYEVWMEKDV